MGRLEGESYKPPQRFEAPPSDRGQGGQTPPGGDHVRLTPEPAEGRFTYPLKPIAQRCLAEMRDYEVVEYNSGYRNIQEEIQDSTERVWRENPAPSPISSLIYELIKGFDFPRVAIPYMLMHDHTFFQGRNEKERWTERDKRVLLDAVLEKDSRFPQEQLDYDAFMQAYYPELYLDYEQAQEIDEQEWESKGYEDKMLEEERETYQRTLRVNRQLQKHLRQRGEAPSDRKVIPLR